MKRGELYIIGGLIASTLISGLILSSSTASANDYQKTALIRVESACTLDGTVSNPHQDTITNGTYKSEIGETVLSAVCNDGSGFGVYAIGYTNDTDGNNVMKHATDDTFNIATGTATSGDTSNWAMKVTAVENGADTPTIENGYSSYKAVPSDYDLVASYPAATSENSNVSFNTHYAAYISLLQHSGVYTGKVKYVLVHPASNAPEKVCLDFDCAAGNLPKHSGYYAMQDIQTICPKVQTPADNTASQSTTLIDLRDNKLYNVVKMPDGHCWMQNDLDLDLTNSDVQTAMTTNDYTNASSTTLNYLFNGGGTAESKYAASPIETFVTEYSDWTSSYGSASYGTPRMSKLMSGVIPSNTVSQENSWKAGMLYNPCAAFAGSFCYSSSEGGPGEPAGIDSGLPGSEDHDMDNLDIPEDICPSGWRVPTGSYYYYPASSYYGLIAHMAEFESLLKEHFNSSAESLRSVMHFPLSGFYNYANANGAGQQELYVTSSISGRYSIYTMSYYDYTSGNDNFGMASSYDRTAGYSIRCLSK